MDAARLDFDHEGSEELAVGIEDAQNLPALKAPAQQLDNRFVGEGRHDRPACQGPMCARYHPLVALQR